MSLHLCAYVASHPFRCSFARVRTYMYVCMHVYNTSLKNMNVLKLYFIPLITYAVPTQNMDLDMHGVPMILSFLLVTQSSGTGMGLTSVATSVCSRQPGLERASMVELDLALPGAQRAVFFTLLLRRETITTLLKDMDILVHKYIHYVYMYMSYVYTH